MNVKILSMKRDKDFFDVFGLVPARCALGYYKVEIKIKNGKIIESHCECGERMCTHAVKLHLAFMRIKDKLPS